MGIANIVPAKIASLRLQVRKGRVIRMKRGVKKQALVQRLRKNRMEERLRADLEATKRSLESAQSNFQNVVDEELIDCCIYEVNAAQSRYAFLLRKLKEFQGVTCENS